MSAYRIAETRSLELPWLGRVKPAFEKAAHDATRKTLGSVGGFLLAIVAVILTAIIVTPAAIFGLLVLAIVGKLISVQPKLHDPTAIVRKYRSDDLVEWAVAVAEREGHLVVGSAFANMLFGLAAERDGGTQSALELYSEAARDISGLHRETAIESVASIACIRGAILAARLGDLAVAQELIAVLDRFRAKEPPANLRHLPEWRPNEVESHLTKDLAKAEQLARRLAVGEESPREVEEEDEELHYAADQVGLRSESKS